MYESTIIGCSIAIIILIAFYAYFSALESAITLVDKSSWVTKSAKKNTRKYKLGLYFINHYLMSLNTVLISQTLLSVGATALSTVLFTEVGLIIGLNSAESFGAGISSGIITILFLIIGDSIPKTLAKNNPFKIFNNSIFLFIFFYYLFYLFSYLLTKLVHYKNNVSATQEQLKNLVKIMNDEGVIDDEAESLIKRSINFSNIYVKDIIESKSRITHIHDNFNYYDVYETFIKCRYSRIPVLDEDNKIVGIALLKLFLDYLDPKNDEKNAENFEVSDIMEAPLIVSKDEKIDDALRKMQMQRMHIAIVINNYENQIYEGIITFEDIIEEIFGPVYDETENDIIPYEQIDDNTWKVSSNTNMYLFLKNHFYLKYKINHNLTIYQFIKEQLRQNKKIKRNQFEWQDKYIIITWTKSLRTKKLYFAIKKKDLHDEEVDDSSLTEILFINNQIKPNLKDNADIEISVKEEPVSEINEKS